MNEKGIGLRLAEFFLAVVMFCVQILMLDFKGAWAIFGKNEDAGYEGSRGLRAANRIVESPVHQGMLRERLRREGNWAALATLDAREPERLHRRLSV